MMAQLRASWGVMPAKRIAEALGVTPSAVIGKANRLGLEPISDETRKEWLRLGYAEAIARMVA